MELWDLYDSDLENTHKSIPARSKVPDGFYHLALEIWIINKDKKVLLVKNSIDYSRRYPGSWSCVGSSLLSPEDPLQALDRIIDQKIGVKISTDNKIMLDPVKRDPHGYAYITCILFSDVNIDDIKFKDGNSTKAKFVDKKELLQMCDNGEIAYYLISRMNDIVDYLD